MQVLDIADQPIDVGDTVVYGVSSERPTLKIGTVEALVPFESTRTIPNPQFTEFQPQTYGIDSANPRWIREAFTDYKIKVREPDNTGTDHQGNPYHFKGKAKTLDRPQRFAVIKKGE